FPRLIVFLRDHLIRRTGIVGGNAEVRGLQTCLRRDGRTGLPGPGSRHLSVPRTGQKLPFRTDPNGTMDFGSDQVEKRTPRLDHHPEEWMGRDAVFERSDVDPLVKRAIYTTMIRCVSEVVISKGPRVLMVKAVRGFSKGYWNIPGGFMDYGEGPETGVMREAEEE